MNSMIYMDYAATTKLDDFAMEQMIECQKTMYGNPSSVYSFSRASKKIIDECKKTIGTLINGFFKDIYFTSGGTESINWAIRGVADANAKKGKHIITTCIEHHATLETCKYLESQGFEITYLPVDKEGKISLKKLKEAIREDTILISIIYVNNEIGSIQPIKEIGKICNKKNIIFHVDAVQAIGHILIDVEEYSIDLMSFSAHKIHGPKGIGGLYIRNGLNIKPLILGGAQQNYKRAGTENVPGICGFKFAVDKLKDVFDEENERLREYRNILFEGIKEVGKIKLNGPVEEHFKVSNILNVQFEGIESETLLFLLDQSKIMVSAGSACASGALDPSHVLVGIGLTEDEAMSSLRFSIGRYTTRDEIKKVIDILKMHVTHLREL